MILKGIRVVELGQNLAGPFAGAILADLGADVIKVEKPEGDDARKWGPPFWPDGSSAAFHGMNRNKRSVTVDVRDDGERERLLQLIGTADVFVHNLRPGAADKLGLGAADLCERFPRLVYCDMGAFGHDGPLALRPGYEPLLQAFAGLVSINGDPDGPPARMGCSLVDLGTGMWTVIGALAALQRRSVTGEGGLVRTSLFETALRWAGLHIESYAVSGKVPERHGTGHPVLVPYQAFETANGPLVVTAGNDRLFARLAEVLGRPEWATDPRYATNADRYANKPEMLRLISEILATDTRERWAERLEAAGVPCAPINSIPEVYAHPQTAALGILQQPPGAPAPMVGLPISFGDARPAMRSVGPALGADNDAVFGSGA
ncbi:MAG: CoA transferase [Burkholderiales bacterium]|nr:MAG: CoA transferase [Burkholderiales bacterium]